MGTLSLVLVWVWPLPYLGLPPFSLHMLGHMIVVAVAPPLLVLASRGGPYDPVDRAPWLFSAVLASMLEFCVVWAFHTPALHAAARTHMGGRCIEQAAFLLSGLWLWFAALGGDALLRRPRVFANATGLLLTSMHMILLGVLIAVAPRSLYSHAHDTGTLSAMQDQQLGAVIMVVIGGVSYLGGALAVFAEALRERGDESRVA